MRDVLEIRASDADREAVVDRLRDDYAEGRLTADELAERIAAAHAAKTRGDLAVLTRDLPTPYVRGDDLERAVAEEVAFGWRVEWRGPGEAIVSRPKRVSHVFHGVLTVLTGGLWGIVWIAIVLDRNEQRQYLGLDEHGRIVRRRIR